MSGNHKLISFDIYIFICATKVFLILKVEEEKLRSWRIFLGTSVIYGPSSVFIPHRGSEKTIILTFHRNWNYWKYCLGFCYLLLTTRVKAVFTTAVNTYSMVRSLWKHCILWQLIWLRNDLINNIVCPFLDRRRSMKNILISILCLCLCGASSISSIKQWMDRGNGVKSPLILPPIHQLRVVVEGSL